IEPLHARLLIWPQSALQRSTGIDTRQALGTSQACERLRQPGTSHGLAPIDIRLRGAVIGKVRAGQHAHRLAERQSVGLGAALDRLELLERTAQPLMVDLDPFPANKDKSVGLRQE